MDDIGAEFVSQCAQSFGSARQVMSLRIHPLKRETRISNLDTGMMFECLDLVWPGSGTERRQQDFKATSTQRFCQSGRIAPHTSHSIRRHENPRTHPMAHCRASSS